jgi:hypothetical protein
MRLGQYVVGMDLYRILGVSREASTEQIRRAYRRLAVRSHPDLNPGAAIRAEREMARINVAAHILSDPLRRAAYDRQRARLTAVVSREQRGAAPCGCHRYPWSVSQAPTSGGAESWVGPSRTAHCPLVPERELSALLARLRFWPARSMCAVARLLDGWSPHTHAKFTLATVCLSCALIACARPRSLPMFEDDTKAARHAASHQPPG